MDLDLDDEPEGALLCWTWAAPAVPCPGATSIGAPCPGYLIHLTATEAGFGWDYNDGGWEFAIRSLGTYTLTCSATHEAIQCGFAELPEPLRRALTAP